MNRPIKPKLEGFPTAEYILDMAKYDEDIEKYCDHLEKENEKLSRVLNEACEYCNCDFLQIEDMYCIDNNGNCKECIKNHFLKEVKDD